MRTLFVTYRGAASDRFDREHFVNKHLPLAREIAEPLGMLSIGAFFPTSPATNILAASVIVLRDEQADAIFSRLPDLASWKMICRITQISCQNRASWPLSQFEWNSSSYNRIWQKEK